MEQLYQSFFSPGHLNKDQMKIKLSKEKTYSICTCGLSKKLPLCDNNHRKTNKINNTNYKSLKMTPKKNAIIDMTSSKWKN